MWQFWLIASGIFFIAEAITVGFLIFWLGIGALIAMVVSFFTDSLIIQMAVFVITSTLLLFATRPFVTKYVNSKTIATNSFSIIGKKAIVIQEINTTLGKGQIKLNGDVWSAKTEKDSVIPEGTEVEIFKIDGVKAVVAPVSKVVTQTVLNHH